MQGVRNVVNIVLAAAGIAILFGSIAYMMLCLEPPTQWVPYHYEQGHYEADWPID